MTAVEATYRLSADARDRFVALLAQHQDLLLAKNLVTATTTAYIKDTDEGLVATEVILWTSTTSDEEAHKDADIAALWDTMDSCCEKRGDHGTMSFVTVDVV